MEKKIIFPFLYHDKLKFNEIEKQTKIRSNKLAYHLNNLMKKGVLVKEKENYQLSETAEVLIPHISEKNSTLSVILIALEKNKEVFLIQRKKRPFKDKLGLPGGRLLEGESIKKAVKRIIKEKFNINAELKKINSVSLEHVKKNNKKIHSFLLIFTTAKTKDKIEYTNIEKNKSKIISSDYKLIKEDLDKETKIKEIISKD